MLGSFSHSRHTCGVVELAIPDNPPPDPPVSKKGNIIEIDKKSKIYQKQIALGDEYTYTPSDGEKIGTHNGAHNYTIGQRKGLSVGGKKEPLFVLRIDVKDNVVYVGMGDNHPGLFRQSLALEINKTHWIGLLRRSGWN